MASTPSKIAKEELKKLNESWARSRCLVISSDSPKEKYFDPPKYLFNFVKNQHNGQRKLLINEILFMTLNGHLSYDVVYVGAATGEHIPVLSKMFPKHTFYCYDPAVFSKLIKEYAKSNSRVKLFNDFFNDDDVVNYVPPKVEKPVLFICDIRTNYSDAMGLEKAVQFNMQQQRKWVELMTPAMAMLKMRFPFTEGETEYFNGDIYVQPWAKKFSAETRLITDGSELTTYNHKDYESMLFWHNLYVRQGPHSYPGFDYEHNKGYDRCYDCRHEIAVLMKYIESEHARFKTIDRINRLMKKNVRSLIDMKHKRNISRRTRINEIAKIKNMVKDIHSRNEASAVYHKI